MIEYCLSCVLSLLIEWEIDGGCELMDTIKRYNAATLRHISHSSSDGRTKKKFSNSSSYNGFSA